MCVRRNGFPPFLSGQKRVNAVSPGAVVPRAIRRAAAARGWGRPAIYEGRRWLRLCMEVKNMAAKLTPKQEQFVTEYLVDFNATQAAIRAGYNPRSARTAAARNMQNDNVQAALIEARQEQQERTHITADRVLKELAAVAFDDADDCNDSRLRYTNKLKALELIGKHLGMFTEKVSVDMQESGVVLLPPRKEG